LELLSLGLLLYLIESVEIISCLTSWLLLKSVSLLLLLLLLSLLLLCSDDLLLSLSFPFCCKPLLFLCFTLSNKFSFNHF